MFIAHLPAGYLLTRRIERRLSRRGWLALGLAASVLPDLDLVRFYLLDGRRVLHHAYWSHVPFWWATLAAVWFSAAWLARSRRALVAGAVVFANVFVHLLLDTVAGRVQWLAPFSPRAFALFTVPARHGWWVWSFVLHPTFLVELAIATWALVELTAVRRARPALTAPAPAPRPLPRA